MIRSSNFWTHEKDAPLLILNRNFLRGTAEDVTERVALWPAIAGISDEAEPLLIPEVDNPDRIFIADAERTFRHADNKKKFVKILAYLTSTFKDYHQGLGYVSSFFLLTMEEPAAISLLSRLNQQEKYIPGYWKHEAIAFATDAYVFRELLIEHFPDIAAHLQKNTIDPATYCQKWFVGLCVHVLPFEYLFLFFEKFLKGGYIFLMQFGLSLMKHLKPRILSINNPVDLFALLRLDPKQVAHDPQLYQSMLSDADTFDLSDIDFAPLRAETYIKHLKQRVESAHAVLNKKDDVIEDCEICEDDFPEFYCKECALKICENCHKNPPSDSTHKKSHAVTEIDEEEGEKDEDEDEEKSKVKTKISISEDTKDNGEVNELAQNISELKV